MMNNEFRRTDTGSGSQPEAVISRYTKKAPEKRDRLFFFLFFLIGYLFFAVALKGGMHIGATLYFVTLFIITGIYLAPRRRKDSFYLLCGILGILLSVGFSVSDQLAVKFFSIIAVEFLYLIFAGGVSDNLTNGTDDMSVTGDVFSIFFARSVDEAGAVFRRSDKYPDGGKILRVLVKISLGVILALPVLLIVLPLLIEADGAFKSFVQRITELNIGDELWYIVAAAVLAPFTSGMLFSLKHEKREKKAKVQDFAPGKGIDPVIVSGFLGIISVCYLLYMFSQLAYFFSAFSGMIPEEIKTTAHYARHGFFEMCVVSAIDLILIAVTAAAMKRGGAASKVSCALACFISVFSVLLISTALSKMLLYISMYGASVLRILTSVFMLVLVLCFVLAVLRVFRPSFPYMRILTVVCASVLAVLMLVDVEACVANYNVDVYLNKDAAWHTEDVDVQYLYKLGDPAMPALLRLYKESDNDTVRSVAETFLLGRSSMMGLDPFTGELAEKSDWRDYCVSRAKAENALKEFANIDK